MNSKNFSDLFPPPEFLNIPYAGLSISDTAVRVIQFSGNKGDLRLLKFAEKILPDGLVVAGLITNTDEVAKILREMRKNLKLCHIKVSLPEEKAYLFTTKIPVLLGHGFQGFSLMELPHYGFLSMVHEARTDFAMWFGLLFLLITGPGRCSADALIARA